MSSSSTEKRTVYHASFTHSLSLTRLEHASRALICVGPTGIIEWIEKYVGKDRVEEVLAGHGLGKEGVELVIVEEGGLVPGLIDTHTVSINVD
jgi:cytosine/adenosine deaminase-related metal-dependent hydrolase